MRRPFAARLLGTLALGLLAAASPGVAFGQAGTVTGTVVDAETLQPLPTVQVFIQGTSIGALTGQGGAFSLTNVPPGTHTVTAQRIGYQQGTGTVTVSAGQSARLQLSLSPAVLALQGIVATGLVDPVDGARSPITVGRVSREQMPVAASGAAVQSLQGVVPGVAITRPSGQPGADVSIMLRTPTSAIESNAPLVVVDGVILGGGTVDIESMDIESVEVVKGAAAASLYGSRAASGVIAITTKRGKGLELGRTQFSFRNEVGRSDIISSHRAPTHHAYLMDASQSTYVDRTGKPVDRSKRVLPSAHLAYMDKTYLDPIYDNFSNVFQGGGFNTQNFAIMQNAEDTNFALTLNRYDEEGTLANHRGYERNSFRLNLDHRFMDAISLSVSAYHARDYRDLLDVSPVWGRRAPPDLDLRKKDELGQYVQIPDPLVNFENPLWTQASQENERRGARSLAGANVTWSPLTWATLSANASYDRGDVQSRLYRAKGTPRTLTNASLVADGIIEYADTVRDTWNADAQLSVRRDFGPLNARTTVRGVLERSEFEAATSRGENFFVGGVPRVDMTANRIATSSNEEIRALGYLWDTAFDYAGKYIFTVLGRRDGSSLFGPDNRWHNYYRVAGAWRIAEEPWFNVEGIDEFKLRFAQGTAGGRPQYSYQYETWQVSSTGVTKGTLGNRNLRPEHTTEREATLELILQNRHSFQLTYAWQKTTDQLVPIFLPAFAGYQSQWANMGTVVGNTWEAQIESRLITSPGLNWTTMLTFDRPRSKITEWPSVCQNVAWRWRCAGHGLFEIWGGQWIRQPHQLAEFHQSGAVVKAGRDDEFMVNDDGFLVWVGKGNHYTEGKSKNLWGTRTVIDGITYQWGLPFERLVGNSGSRDQIGEASYMNFGWVNTLRMGPLSFHGHLHASIGGEVVTEQFGLERFNTHSAMDQAQKPDELKKPLQYYHHLQSNRGNSYNVQPADFLKLRTLSMNYRVSQDRLQQFGLANMGMSSMSVGVVGRNLFMLKRCDCIDPEQGRDLNTRMSSVGAAYPSARQITMEVDVTF